MSMLKHQLFAAFHFITLFGMLMLSLSSITELYLVRIPIAVGFAGFSSMSTYITVSESGK